MTPSDLLRRGASELGIELDEAVVARFLSLMGELRKWNRRINLTAIDEEAEIVVKHFIDSLTLLPYIPEKGTLLDIGSGGGFPSLPLKVLRPSLSIVSVDSVDKKISFQKHAARLLELEDFLPLHIRAEALPERYAGYFDAIVSRAFSSIPKFASLALPLLKPGGVILAMKGKEGRTEGGEAEEQLRDLGLALSEIVEFPLPCSGDPRSILKIVRP